MSALNIIFGTDFLHHGLRLLFHAGRVGIMVLDITVDTVAAYFYFCHLFSFHVLELLLHKIEIVSVRELHVYPAFHIGLRAWH